MSGALSLGLLGLAFSFFLILDLYRGRTFYSHFRLSRAEQPLAYWSYMGVTAVVTLTFFLGAFQLWSLGCEGFDASAC